MKRPTSPRLKITEIFLSIQGESSSVGWPTVFVRLTGCPLRCQYCDTAYAFHGGEWQGACTCSRCCAMPATAYRWKPVVPWT
jgi:organic radical activating enzyme